MSKFKVGDKVVALKGFHTIKIGDILTVENSDEYWLQAVECRGYTLHVANYELYKPKFSNMKFRVSSPEQSKEIQEALFEMGYVWKSGKTCVQFENDTGFFVTNEDGKLSMYDDKYCLSSAVLGYKEHQEYEVETTKAYKLIPVEAVKETITIDGKTYDKEAVLKRLAELESI